MKLLFVMIASLVLPVLATAQTSGQDAPKTPPAKSEVPKKSPPIAIDDIFKDLEKDAKNAKRCDPKPPVSEPIA